jgi:hypothetical protein
MRKNYNFLKYKPVPAPKPLSEAPFSQIQLDETVDWYSAISHQQQILVLGKREGQLLMARFDGLERVEYHHLGFYVEETNWLFSPENTPDLAIYYPANQSITSLFMEENADFTSSFNLHFIHWLPPMTYGACLTEDGRMAVIYSLDAPDKDGQWHKRYALSLGIFTIDGNLISQVAIKEKIKENVLLIRGLPRFLTKMRAGNGNLFLSANHCCYIIDLKTGQYQWREFLHNHIHVAILTDLPDWTIVISRISESDGRIFFQLHRSTTKDWEDDIMFGPPDEPKNLPIPHHSDSLCAIGFVKKSFFSVFKDRVDFYNQILTEIEPKIGKTIYFPENILDGFSWGIQSGLCGFLTAKGKILVYDCESR